MNCQILKASKDEYHIKLDYEGVKLLSLMLIKISNYYKPSFSSLSIRIQKRKMVPFFLENFVKFLKAKQFSSQLQYMEQISNSRKSKTFRSQDLSKMFINRENIEVQLKWIDYLEGFAAVDIMRRIQSKKVQYLYLQNLYMLQQQIREPKPYQCFIKSPENYIPSLNQTDYYEPPLNLIDKKNISYQRLNKRKKMIIKML
ncbi:hypothetical protein pb186bvf_020131 [Paramecium bursaria]